MDNLTTLKTVKSSILEGLAVLKPIVESLERDSAIPPTSPAMYMFHISYLLPGFDLLSS